MADLVHAAQEANTDVLTAHANLRRARSLHDAALAGLWPAVHATTSAEHGRSATTSGNTFGAALDASWELDLFGTYRHGTAAA